jgi:hypothetical protein
MLIRLKNFNINRVLDLLTLLRFPGLISQKDSTVVALELDDKESFVVSSLAQVLLGTDEELKREACAGLLSGKGDFEGTSCEWYARWLDTALIAVPILN